MAQMKRGSALTILLVLVFLQACAPATTSAPAESLPATQPAVEQTATKEAVNTPLPTPVAVIAEATQTEIPTAAAAQSSVTIGAVKGNLFIRRGPDMAFNPIGVLYEGSSTKVIARDVLSKWAQIKDPKSDAIGWVSLQTKYSQLDGDLATLPEVTVEDWPIPAYLRNCSYHRMYVLPSQIYLESYLSYPENEIWLYPGEYTVYDLEAGSDPVEVLQVSIREGSDVEVLVNGLGEKRICP